MGTLFLYILSFLLFTYLQALAINGVYEAFKGRCVNDMNNGNVCSGNIFYKLNPLFFEKYKGKNWTLPLWGCVKCMASFWGSITYWGTVVSVFGFHTIEMWVWIWDIFILVSVNYFVYKSL
jgi:hypothetical protein